MVWKEGDKLVVGESVERLYEKVKKKEGWKESLYWLVGRMMESRQEIERFESGRKRNGDKENLEGRKDHDRKKREMM